MRFKLMAVVVLLWGLYLAVLDGMYVTPWFAILWGLVAGAGLWQLRVQEGRIEQALPAGARLALAVGLIVATAIATYWASPGRRDLIQLGYTLFTLPIYADGFAYGMSVVRRAGGT
jgi:hypothetical protein